MAENVLAVDCGTQSVRALLFNPQGDLLAKARIPIEPYFSTAPGLAEQDPNVFWDALCLACKKLFAQKEVQKDSIAAVSITTQRATVVNLDKNGRPLRPAIIWLDQRRAEEFPPVKGLWGAAFTLSGAKPTVQYLQAECEANWIHLHQPDIWKNTYKFTYLSGYLAHLLTDRFVDSIGCQVGYMPFDYKKQNWAANSHWYWQALAITRDKLVDLVPVSGLLGKITPEASTKTGIPAGLPLIASAADKACEVLGAGSLEPNVACLSYGTTATINTTHKKYIEIVPLIPPYPAAVPDLYNLELQIYRGYWMVNWFKNEFGLREQRLAKETGVEPEVLFDKLVRSVPPGSQGLVLQPYWSPGLRHPGPEARGAIIGFNDVHTRAHLYRAILEGLAYALREGKDRTEKRAKIRIDQVRVAGGGSQSDAAMQLTADIFGLPVSRPHLYEASGLGAAINAAVGVGIHTDYPTAIQAMTHLGDTFYPEPKARVAYDQLYNQVYLRMYKHLKPFYKAMQNITLPLI
ncbi:MAG: FGGY-family carbohydrate kinase [Anaerolineaceae bacterium]|nr:FGGY-family carbohydrate kinase [Anaerolineaceae bacterium]